LHRNINTFNYLNLTKQGDKQNIALAIPPPIEMGGILAYQQL